MKRFHLKNIKTTQYRTAMAIASVLIMLITVVLLGIPSMVFASTGDTADQLKIDKTAMPLNQDYQSTVTLTLPGKQESYSYDVVFVLDRSNSASTATAAVMSKYIDAVTEHGANIKTGVVCFYYDAAVIKELSDTDIDYEAIQAVNTIEWGIAHGIPEAQHRGQPYGTNLAAGIAAGKALLDADTSLADPSHKLLIVISDGDTHVFSTSDGTPAVVVDERADGSKVAGPAAYERKYGSYNPPDDWDIFLSTVKAQMDIDGDEYYYTKEIHYNNSYGDAEKAIPNDELSQHAVTSDIALYQAYQNYKAAKDAGYMTYAVGVVGTNRIYGPSFMNYLNGGEELSLDDLIDTIYYVSAGSTVTDVMGAGKDSEGNHYDFDFIDDLSRINVKLNGVTLEKKTGEGGYVFYQKEQEDTALFMLVYDAETDGFTFTINTNITVMDELQIIYDVQLTNPNQINSPGEYKNLHTNSEAVLHPTDSQGKAGADENFPDPVLFYENPDIDKKILENEKSVKKNDVSIGDMVTYQVPITIPENVFEVDMCVTDTIFKGLTLDTASLSADQDVTGLSFEKVELEDSDHQMYKVKIPASIVKANAGKTLTLTYSASLNADAVIDNTNGNQNTVRLDYNVHDVKYNEKTLSVDIQSADCTVATDTHQIQVKKVDENGTSISGVTFTLQNGVGKYFDSDTGWSDKEVNYTTSGDVLTFRRIDSGTYILTEKSTPKQYESLSEPMKITVSEDGDITCDGADAIIENGVVVVTNKTRKTEVQFKKTDMEGTALRDAEFTLKAGDSDTQIVSDENGIMKTSDGKKKFGLTAGDVFELTETKSPAGYHMLSGKVSIQYDGKMVTAKKSDDPEVSYQCSYDEASGIWTVTITNQTGGILPSSGGFGTKGFMISGLLLIVTAGAISIMNKRMHATLK